MISLKLNNQINYYLTSLLAFFIPIHSKIPPILIVLLVLNWLVKPSNVKLTFQRIKSNYALFSLIILFIFYAFGVLLSDNMRFGLKVLETNLSLILLPLVYLAYQDSTREKIESYLKYFVIGCITYTLLCFGYASYAFFKPIYTDLYGVMYDLGANYFFYSYLSLFFHPSYTAMYSVFALLIISVGVIKKKIVFTWKITLSILLLVVFVLLLSSKAGWLGLLLLVIYVSVHLISKNQIITISYLLIPLVALFMLFNVYYTPEFSKRLPQIENIKNAITEKDKENNKVTTSASDGNASRVFIWKASFELFQENLLGIGTGDAKEILMQKYLDKGMTSEYESQLNSHNQYLSIALSLGAVGLLLFCFVLIYPLFMAFKSHKYILIGFMILVSINFLFESMLETQKGLVFFAFFYTLLCSTFVKNKIDNNNDTIFTSTY